MVEMFEELDFISVSDRIKLTLRFLVDTREVKTVRISAQFV